MARGPEVLVVGGGIAGLASAWHLARAGRRVTLVEAAPQLGVHSSAQNAAILRSLIADPDLTRIGRAAAERLHRPPAGFVDRPLVEARGLLLTADPHLRDWLLGWPATMPPAPYAECRAEPVDARTARRLLPPFEPPAVDDPTAPFALWLPDEGEFDVALLVEAFGAGARHASAAGGVDAELLLGREVRELLAGPDGAVVGARLDDGTELRAEQVLLATGAWATALARPHGSPLAFAPRRRHLAVSAHGEPAADPAWPVVWNQGTDFYARPESGGLLLCGCDETRIEPTGPPSAGPCPRDDAALELLAERTARFLPGFADARIAHWWAGWRTFTETGGDGHPFALGPDPVVPGLFWAAGLGGHGMTSAFEVGRLAALELVRARGERPHGELEGEDYGAAFRPRAAVAPA